MGYHRLDRSLTNLYDNVYKMFCLTNLYDNVYKMFCLTNLYDNVYKMFCRLRCSCPRIDTPQWTILCFFPT